MSPFSEGGYAYRPRQCRTLVPIEIVREKKNDPFGVRILFGWSIYGSDCRISMESTSHNAVSHFMSSRNIDVQISRL